MKSGWPALPLAEALHQRMCNVSVNAAESYQFAGVYCFGRGVFRGQEKLGNQFAYQRLTRLRSGDFVYPKLMAWEGAFGIVPQSCDGCVVSPEFPVFELTRDRITPEFLNFYFQIPRVWEEVSGGSTGTNVRRRRLHPVDFLRAKIPMPPVREQRRLVAQIEELAVQIHEANTLRHRATEEAEALFESSVGTRFSSLPKHPARKLETLTTKIGSGSTPSGGRAAYPSSGIPFIRSLNVRMRQFQWDDIAFISQETHNSMSGTCVRPRDVLLNITGASIGRVACAPDNIDEANVNQHVAIIRPNEELEARYLMYWLSQPAIQDFINDEQKGATRQGFTKAQVQAFEVPLLPLPEQRRIVAELDALQGQVHALRRLQTETAAELDALLPAILDRAFKGQL